MRSLTVYLSEELKAKLESHPDYRYGKCADFNTAVFKRFVESPEFQLDIEKDKNKLLERRVASLTEQLRTATAERDQARNSSAEWIGKFMELRKSTPPAASLPPAAPPVKAPDSVH